MGKDKLTPQQIGRVLFEIFKRDMKKALKRFVKDIKKIRKDIKLDRNRVYTELTYLYFYIYCKVIYSRFKTHFEQIEKSFKNEFKEYLGKFKSEEFTLKALFNLNEALIYYMEKHNQTLTKEQSIESRINFAAHIAKKSVGKCI